MKNEEIRIRTTVWNEAIKEKAQQVCNFLRMSGISAELSQEYAVPNHFGISVMTEKARIAGKLCALTYGRGRFA